MKKLLMTTALVTLMAAPAVAEQVIVQEGAAIGKPVTSETTQQRVNADGSITETTITETLTPHASTSLMVTSEVSKMDILKHHDWDGDGDYDHKHTVITIEGMTPEQLNARIGDQDGDGDIDRYDLSAYVGDTDNDGDIDYVDYMNRFGDQSFKVKYTYDYDPNYDGTTAYIAPGAQAVIVDKGVNLETSETVRVRETDPVIRYEKRTTTGYRMNR